MGVTLDRSGPLSVRLAEAIRGHHDRAPTPRLGAIGLARRRSPADDRMGSGDVGLIGGRPSIIIELDERLRAQRLAGFREACETTFPFGQRGSATTRSMCVSPQATDAHNLLEPAAGHVPASAARVSSVVTPSSG
jgi:hypothetical protein